MSLHTQPSWIKGTLSPSSSSSSSSSGERQWCHTFTLEAVKRQQTQAERMRELDDLEQRVTDAANWSKRRADMMPRRPHQEDDGWKKRSSAKSDLSYQQNRSSSVWSTTTTTTDDGSARYGGKMPNGKEFNKLDLHDASLEDLEGLIAASAQRLASYRLKNRSSQVDEDRPDSESSSNSSITRENNNFTTTTPLVDLLGDFEEDNDTPRAPSLLLDDHLVPHATSKLMDGDTTSSPASPPRPNASVSFMNIRNKFELKNDRSKLIMQFDPLVVNNNARASQPTVDLLTGPDLAAEIPTPSESILSPSQSTLHNKKKPTELRVEEIAREKSSKRSPLSDSPKTPMRLPTPKSSLTSASNTFPRTSLPTPARSTSRRVRTLSSVSKDNDSIAWLESEMKPTKLSVAAQAENRNGATDGMLQMILLYCFKYTDCAAGKKTSLQSSKADSATQHRNSASRTTSTNLLRDIEDEHVASHSARVRTMSMVNSTMRNGMKSGRSDRDLFGEENPLDKFDPLLCNDNASANTPHLLDEDARFESKLVYPPLRAANSKEYELPSASTIKRKVVQQQQQPKVDFSSEVDDDDVSESRSTRTNWERKRGKVSTMVPLWICVRA